MRFFGGLKIVVLLLGLILACGLPGSQALAQGNDDGPAKSGQQAPSRADVKKLINTIEDPTAREKLVGQLRLLVQADAASRDSEDPGLLSLVTDEISDISSAVLTSVASLSDVSHMTRWIRLQVSDPGLRARWIEILSKLAGIFAGGFVAERIVLLLLRRPVRLLNARRPANRLKRIPVAVGLWLLQLVPVAVFLFAAQSLRSQPELALGAADGAALLINTAYAMSRLVLISEQAILTPNSSELRAAPLDDETANYLFIWARRLTLTGVWGYFIAQALRMLGLPKTGYLFSLKVLGLLIATLVIILVLQNRQLVAAWIRRQGESRALGPRVKGLRNRLADVWHILAMLYVIALFFIWALQVKGGLEYILRASVLTVVVLIVANLLAGLLARLVGRAFSVSDELKSRFPQLEGRANRYMAIMQNVVRGALYLVTLLALAQVWGADVLAWLTGDVGRQVLSSVVSIAAVLIGALIVWELVNSSIERYLAKTEGNGDAAERRTRARTLLPLLRNLVLVVLVVLVALIVLSELGVNIAPLLAGAGVVGVAIGFGSQKLVQDVITGAFILFEDTIAVGDVIKIGEFSGVVEGLTIRTLRLRDISGNVHTLPFSSVGTVTNMTRDFAYHVFDIGVAYREDIGEVMGVLKQVGEELRGDADVGPSVLEPVEVFGIEKFGDSAVVLRGRIKTLPGKQWSAGREFYRRVKARFDELGIEMPYPHTTLYFGVDKDGHAPAANLRVVTTAEKAVPPPQTLPFKGDTVDYPEEERDKPR